MRRKIQNPNDINNPIKMGLSIHRIHDYDTAEKLLADLRGRYDSIALSTMDPVSSAPISERDRPDYRTRR
jgi:hypothetical protein